MIRFHYHRAVRAAVFGRVRIEPGDRLCHVYALASAPRRRREELAEWALANDVPVAWLQEGWQGHPNIPHFDLWRRQLRKCCPLSEAVSDAEFVKDVRAMVIWDEVAKRATRTRASQGQRSCEEEGNGAAPEHAGRVG